MSRLNDRVSKLESASSPAAPRLVTTWLQEHEGGPVTNRETGEVLSAEAWAHFAAETDGLHIIRTLVSPSWRSGGPGGVQ